MTEKFSKQKIIIGKITVLLISLAGLAIALIFTYRMTRSVFFSKYDIARIRNQINKIDNEIGQLRESLPGQFRREIEKNIPLPSEVQCPGDSAELTIYTGISAIYGSMAAPVIGDFLSSPNYGVQASLEETSFSQLSKGLSCRVVDKGCSGIALTGSLKSPGKAGSTGSIQVRIICSIANDSLLAGNTLTGVLNGAGKTTVWSGIKGYLVKDYSFSEGFKVYVSAPAVKKIANLNKSLSELKGELENKQKPLAAFEMIVGVFSIIFIIYLITVASLSGLILPFKPDLARRFWRRCMGNK